MVRYKKKIQSLLLINLCMVLGVVLLTSALLRRQKESQAKMESQLPFGDYLPTSQNPFIRVLLKNTGFLELVHHEVSVTCDGGMRICAGEVSKQTSPGEVLTFYADDVLFQSGSIRIESNSKEQRLAVTSLQRGYGQPSYRGTLELYSTAEGIVIVNELPLEEYLYAVVPSEMPSTYAKEALKCQAICARSYAYCQMLTFAYPQYLAHVDDSVSFQVYGNSREHENTTLAVQETAGEKLWYLDQVVKTYYYSTSCGHSTDVAAWGSTVTKQNQYLTGIPICDDTGEAYEKDLAWYRWKVVLSADMLKNLIEKNTKTEVGNIQEVAVTKRGSGGVVLELVVKGDNGSVTVYTENKIRTALGGGGVSIEKQDGSVAQSGKLLPSAFFEITKSGDAYIISGGGYGHGIGMSQNGANEMAKEGKTYEEILTFFYSGAKVD